jgi:hypothetical protein
MKIPRLYTGDDGESHWEDIEVALQGSGGITTSAVQPATGVMFIRLEGEHTIDWHTAPRRQYVIVLEGEVEYEIGDGSRRTFGPGGIFLADDLTGRGHAARLRDLVEVFVPVED